MAQVYRESRGKRDAVRLHKALSQFPTVCFVLALLTDLAYWRTANLMWQNFSDWLLFAGVVFGAVAALAGVVELFWRRSGAGPTWIHAIGGLIVLIVAFLNNLVHSGDGWTAVVPWGLTLSALTVVLLIVTNFYGYRLDNRRLVPEARDAGDIPL